MSTYKASRLDNNIPPEVATRMLSTRGLKISNKQRKEFRAAREVVHATRIPIEKRGNHYTLAEDKSVGFTMRCEKRVKKLTIVQLINLYRRLPMKRSSMLREQRNCSLEHIKHSLGQAILANRAYEKIVRAEIERRAGENNSFSQCNRRQVSRAVRNGTTIPCEF